MTPQWNDLARLVNEEKRAVYVTNNDHRRRVLGVLNEIIILSETDYTHKNWETLLGYYYHTQELIQDGWTIEPLEEEKWVPSDGQEYIYIHNAGEEVLDNWYATSNDLFRLSIGNVFPSTEEGEQQAKAWREKLIERMKE